MALSPSHLMFAERPLTGRKCFEPDHHQADTNAPAPVSCSNKSQGTPSVSLLAEDTLCHLALTEGSSGDSSSRSHPRPTRPRRHALLGRPLAKLAQQRTMCSLCSLPGHWRLWPTSAVGCGNRCL